MIAFLQGKLVESLPTKAVLDVQGVGYEVNIPLSTFEKLPLPGATVHLLTHLQIREDEHVLFGFFSHEEKDIFKLLVTHVSGVGPKLALAFLNGCTPEQFRAAVTQTDTTFLSKIKGVGKKTAERVIIELRDKVGVTDAWAADISKANATPEQQKQNDALLALIALGYKQAEAVKALKELDPALGVDGLIREALKRI